jgi:N-glycosylase/DNA lyase
VKAAKTLYEEGPGLSSILKNCTSEHEVRDLLVENIYGIGLKEASHFLRDIGYSNSLAIIDSHVIAFLAELGVVPTNKSNGVTPGLYTRLEGVLQNLCDDLGVDLSIFDMAIWQYMRGRSE